MLFHIIFSWVLEFKNNILEYYFYFVMLDFNVDSIFLLFLKKILNYLFN